MFINAVMKTSSPESPALNTILEPVDPYPSYFSNFASCQILSSIGSHHATAYTASSWQGATSAGQEASREFNEGIYEENVSFLLNLVSFTPNIHHSVTRNMSQSPLLRLAPEIREMIWEAAIGNRTIHIKHFSAEQLKSLQRHQTYPEATEANGAFRHIECVATTTEEEAYIASKTQNTRVPAGENSAYYVQSYKSRHYNCYQLENGAHGKNAWVSLFEQGDYLISEKDRITLCTMLGTCRQIYGEAYRIFWLSNAFSFDDPFSFREFLGSLTLSQKQHLTNLHICERLNHLPGVYGFEWEDTLRRPGGKSIIDLLSGLRTFNLCFEQRFNTEHSFNAHISLWGWLSNLSQPWLALRPAPLANVTVIISDKQSLMQRSGLMHLRCTVQRKSEIAEEIRNNIIDETQVAKARQNISDKRAAQKKRYRELKQMKQAEDILKDEINSTAEITHAQANEVSRVRFNPPIFRHDEAQILITIAGSLRINV